MPAAISKRPCDYCHLSSAILEDASNIRRAMIVKFETAKLLQLLRNPMTVSGAQLTINISIQTSPLER